MYEATRQLTFEAYSTTEDNETSPTRPQCYTRETLIEHLQDLYAREGRPPTQDDIKNSDGPGASPYYREFDGIIDAMQIAGIQPASSQQTSAGRNIPETEGAYTRTTLLRLVKKFYENKEDPTPGKLERDNDYPSGHPYRREFGSIAAAAVEAGVADYAVCPECDLAFDRIASHWSHSECSPPDLTPRQIEVIEGCLMGDASIIPNGKSCFFRHHNTQKRFVNWVADELGDWHCDTGIHSTEQQTRERIERGNSIQLPEGGSVKDLYKASSITHSTLNRWREWYSSGRKRFPHDLNLTPLKLALWYACDGNIVFPNNTESSPGHIITATNEDDRSEYLEALFEAVGLSPQVRNGSIRFYGEQAELFREYVDGPIPGHEYKWSDTRSEYSDSKP